MIENILSVAGDVEIGEAVIVVIADGHSHSVVAVSGIGQPRFLSDVGEAAVFVLPIQPVPVTRVLAIEILRQTHGTGYASAVDQENIEQSIVVVIEQRDATGHGLDQILLRCG